MNRKVYVERHDRESWAVKQEAPRKGRLKIGGDLTIAICLHHRHAILVRDAARREWARPAHKRRKYT